MTIKKTHAEMSPQMKHVKQETKGVVNKPADSQAGTYGIHGGGPEWHTSPTKKY
jgi:hypothetical protein